MGWLIAVLVIVPIAYAQLALPAVRRAKVRRSLRRGSSAFADRAGVTVTGTVRAIGELVESPLSGRRCVVVHAFAELPEIDDSLALPENVRLTTRLMVPFELETNDGPVLVDGTSADLEMKAARISPRSAERERAFVVTHGRSAAVAPVATFREIVVMPGMRISVHGMALVEADHGAERGYRDAASKRHRLVAHPDYPLAIGAPRD